MKLVPSRQDATVESAVASALASNAEPLSKLVDREEEHIGAELIRLGFTAVRLRTLSSDAASSQSPSSSQHHRAPCVWASSGWRSKSSLVLLLGAIDALGDGSGRVDAASSGGASAEDEEITLNGAGCWEALGLLRRGAQQASMLLYAREITRAGHGVLIMAPLGTSEAVESASAGEYYFFWHRYD